MAFRVEEKNSDLYAAVDKAIDKLEGQMRKLKTRMSRRNRQSLGESIAFKILKEKLDQRTSSSSPHKINLFRTNESRRSNH